jgi:hypothetical protein
VVASRDEDVMGHGHLPVSEIKFKIDINIKLNVLFNIVGVRFTLVPVAVARVL